ncbi:MAG: hypothetical protein U5L46_00990, partial [Agrobacterium sp.]|nr:hypothetical protein [Agrobacterium sp.]
SVVSGMIDKETDLALVVRTVTDTVNVAKADLKERRRRPCPHRLPACSMLCLNGRSSSSRFLTTAPR